MPRAKELVFVEWVMTAIRTRKAVEQREATEGRWRLGETWKRVPEMEKGNMLIENYFHS